MATWKDESGAEWDLGDSAPAAPTPTPSAKVAAPVPAAKVDVYKDENGAEWDLSSPSAPAERGFLDRLGDGFKEGSLYGFQGLVSRKFATMADLGMEEFKKQNPGLNEDQYQEKHAEYVNQFQKQLRQEYAAKQAADPNWKADESFIDATLEGKWIPWVLGQIGGSAGPEWLIGGPAGAGARAIGGRMATQAVAGAASDVAYQGADLLDGVADEYSALQTAFSGAMGAGFQGLNEVASAAYRGTKGALGIGKVDEAPKNPFDPGTAADRKRMDETQQEAYEETLRTGTVDDIVNFFNDKPGMSVSKTEAARWVKNRGDGSGAKTVYSDQQYKTPEGQAKPTPVSKRAPKVSGENWRPEDVTAHYDEMTYDWKNAPKMETVSGWKNLPESEAKASLLADPDSKNIIGFVGKDGVIRIDSSKIHSRDQLNAIVFHEALGHSGLTAKFGQDLDGVLTNLYEGNAGNFKKAVDDWNKNNPDAYDGDIPRAADEVLAEMSEKGKIDPSILDPLRTAVAKFARDMGWKNDISDREIIHILGQAHNEIVHGNNDLGGTVLRAIRVFHGTPRSAAFDNVDENNPYGGFDDKFINSGEGAQAYGHGHYVAEDVGIASGRYRDGLSSQKGAKPVLDKKTPEQFYQDFEGIDVLNSELPNYPDGRPPGRKAAEAAGKPLFVKENPLTEQARTRFLNDVKEGQESLKDTLKDIVIDLKYWEGQPNISDTTSFAYDRLVQLKAGKKLYEAAIAKFQKPGALYEIDLPDNGNWLSWDNPPSDKQRPALEKLGIKTPIAAETKAAQAIVDAGEVERAAIRKQQNDIFNKWHAEERKATTAVNYDDAGRLMSSTGESFSKWLEPIRKELASLDKKLNEIDNELIPAYKIIKQASQTGEEIYQTLAAKHMNDKGVSWEEAQRLATKDLQREGFTGNKFLDGNSRSGKKDNHNYVVFDPKDAKFVNRAARKKSPPRLADKNDAGAERRTVGNINLDRLATASPDEVGTILDDMYNQTGKSGDVQTNKATRDLADTLSLTPTQASKLALDYTPEQSLALRDALVTSSENLHAVNKVLEADDSSKNQLLFAQAIAKHVAIQNKVTGLTEQAGRLLQSFNIIAEGKSGLKPREIRAMMQEMGGDILGNPEALMRFSRQLAAHQGSPKAVNKLTQAVFKPKAEDYVLSTWYNGMLSSYTTHVVNMVGTLGNLAVDIGEKAGAAVIGQGRRFSSSRNERISGTEVAQRVWGIVQAMVDIQSYKNAGQSFLSGTTAGQQNVKTGSITNVYQGKKKYVLEAPTRALAAEDEFFRSVITLSDLYGLSVREAKAKGLKGAAFWAEVNRLRTNPSKEFLEHAAEYSKTTQFRDKPSRLAEALVSLQHRRDSDSGANRAIALISRAAVPFVSVSDSLARTAIRRLGPLGIFERENFKALQKGASDADVDQFKARLVMGSAFAGYVAMLTAKGLITDAGPTDFKKKAEWLATHKPNSIKIGDEWYSLKGLDPIAANINAVATAQRALAESPEDADNTARVANAVVGIMGALGDNAYTENFLNFTKMFSSDGQKVGDKFAVWAAGLSGSVIPTAVRQYSSKVTDEAQRNTTGDGSLSDRVSGRIIEGVKGTTAEDLLKAAGVDTDLPQKHDVYGREMNTSVDVTKVEDPVIKELARLSEKSLKVVVGPVQKTVQVDGEKIKLSANDLENFQALAGYYTVEKMREEMETPLWKALSDEEKGAFAKKTASEMKKLAKEELFSEK